MAARTGRSGSGSLLSLPAGRCEAPGAARSSFSARRSTSATPTETGRATTAPSTRPAIEELGGHDSSISSLLGLHGIGGSTDDVDPRRARTAWSEKKETAPLPPVSESRLRAAAPPAFDRRCLNAYLLTLGRHFQTAWRNAVTSRRSRYLPRLALAHSAWFVRERPESGGIGCCLRPTPTLRPHCPVFSLSGSTAMGKALTRVGPTRGAGEGRGIEVSARPTRTPAHYDTGTSHG
jgi:hypothetical protein